MGCSARSFESGSTRTHSTSSSSSVSSLSSSSKLSSIGSSCSSSSSFSLIGMTKPKILPFENVIIAKLLKSSYYLGRNHQTHDKKNKRICEVIDILRYDDDGTLLNKFIKSDKFLIKYLGFDYTNDHDVDCGNARTIYIERKKIDNGGAGNTDPAELYYKGFDKPKLNGGHASSIYKPKNRVDLKGALEQEIFNCKYDKLFKLQGPERTGKANIEYPGFNKNEINGGYSTDLCELKEVIDLRGALEQDMPYVKHKKIIVNGGRANSKFPVEDQVDFRGAATDDLAEIDCESFSEDEIDGGYAENIHRRKIELEGSTCTEKTKLYNKGCSNNRDDLHSHNYMIDLEQGCISCK